MHILIIKEDDANLSWISERLIESGLTANLICVLPAEAVTLVRAIKFNLIIYDVSMPGKASAENVQKLIGEAKNVPVVVLSNSLENGVAHETIKGAYDYIIKDKLKSGIAAECFSVLLSKYKLHYN